MPAAAILLVLSCNIYFMRYGIAVHFSHAVRQKAIIGGQPDHFPVSCCVAGKACCISALQLTETKASVLKQMVCHTMLCMLLILEVLQTPHGSAI